MYQKPQESKERASVEESTESTTMDVKDYEKQPPQEFTSEVASSTVSSLRHCPHHSPLHAMLKEP